MRINAVEINMQPVCGLLIVCYVGLNMHFPQRYRKHWTLEMVIFAPGAALQLDTFFVGTA